MAFNLGGLATGLSAAGGYEPQALQQWQAVQARQKALADAQRQDTARRAFFASLTTPDMAALPQQGPPGPTAQTPFASAGSPPSPMPGAAPSAAPAAAGGQPAASPLSPAPSGAAVPAAASGANFGLSFPDPVARLRQIAQALKRANPGADDLTLATALQQQIDMMKGLAPDDRAALMAETQVMRIQAQSDQAVQRANNQTEIANIRAQTAQEVADVRAAASRYGADSRSNTAGQNREAAMERTVYTQNAIDRRAAQAAVTHVDAKAKAAQYKKIMAARAQLKDAISTASGVATPAQQQQLAALDQQAIKFWSANNWLPRPSELDRMGADQAQAGGAATPSSGAPAPVPNIEPSAPKPTATDAKGNKVEWNGQNWVPMKSSGGQGASPFRPSLPQPGILPGTLHLNPTLAPQVPQGSPRPFAPGEWVQNPGGSWSSEISTTVQMPDGKWSVVPTLWLIGGRPIRVSEDQAVQYAIQSKLPFREFGSEKVADRFAVNRESAWQNIQPQDASKIEPLWSR